MLRIWLAFLLAGAGVIFANEKPNFSGTWTANGAAEIVKLEIQQDEQNIDVRERNGQSELARAYKCTTDGKDCKAKGSDKNATVTLWYNGPMLVEMYQARDGKSVVKTHRTLSEDGSLMKVEVIPIVPAGEKPLTFEYKREQTTAAIPAQ